MSKKLLVTVISGFLGAGKTSLVQNVLQNQAGARIAVITNDRSQGCICCTMREELLDEVTRLAKTNLFDHLLIESNAVSEPLTLAEIFTFPRAAGAPLSEIAELDTMVTVLDAKNFFGDYFCGDNLNDRELEVDEDDDRGLSDLLAEQVEFANIVVINKIDLVTPEELAQVEGAVRHLNPEARILYAENGVVPHAEILDTGLFEIAKAAIVPNGLTELRGEEPPETVEHDFSSFVFHSQRPFHPLRLFNFLATGAWDDILRSKGVVWLASRPQICASWVQAGHSCRLMPFGLWSGAPDSEGEQENEIQPHQELVIIGRNLDVKSFSLSLEDCLLTPAELTQGERLWSKLADPFPTWPELEIAHQNDDSNILAAPVSV